jgi:hypothetical protein
LLKSSVVLRNSRRFGVIEQISHEVLDMCSRVIADALVGIPFASRNATNVFATVM